MVETIIKPVPLKGILSELTEDIFVRPTKNGSNHIYIFKGKDKPNLMLEVGRLRELTFRAAGGGTGKKVDIDNYDKGEFGYSQLIVWDPEALKLVGGYRYVRCSDTEDKEGNFALSSSEIFTYSEELKKNYFPYTIELGRSFVQPHFQPNSTSRKGLFSLDNLWDGLGSLVVLNPEIKYFFGKVTMYTDFNKEARDTILHFLQYYFHDSKNLVLINNSIKIEFECADFMASLQGVDFTDGHKLLNLRVRELGENIPPMFNSYMGLSSTLKIFGTAKNAHFGNVEETGIMITIDDIYDQKKDRYINAYKQYLANKSS